MELRLISLCFYDLQVRDLSIHKITRRFAPEKINKIELYFCIQRMFETICEIKFKYVWRCFIKSRIDFCEILLSLPSRKCGLKYVKSRSYQSQLIVTSLAEVWIEIEYSRAIPSNQASLPSRKCGLKSCIKAVMVVDVVVTSLAEVWIEINKNSTVSDWIPVTSLAEVWIEMQELPQGE